MSQIKEHMPTLIMGGSLLVYGLIANSGALLPVAKYLHTHKALDLQVTMTLIVGCIALLGALINTTATWRDCFNSGNGHGYSLVCRAIDEDYK